MHRLLKRIGLVAIGGVIVAAALTATALAAPVNPPGATPPHGSRGTCTNCHKYSTPAPKPTPAPAPAPKPKPAPAPSAKPGFCLLRIHAMVGGQNARYAYVTFVNTSTNQRFVRKTTYLGWASFSLPFGSYKTYVVHNGKLVYSKSFTITKGAGTWHLAGSVPRGESHDD